MDKINFIEDLFESEIYGVSRFNHNSKDFLEKLNNAMKARKELDSLLNGKEKELFWRYSDLQEQYVMANEFESFKEGFRLGTSCMLDVFNSENHSEYGATLQNAIANLTIFVLWGKRLHFFTLLNFSFNRIASFC